MKLAHKLLFVAGKLVERGVNYAHVLDVKCLLFIRTLREQDD